MFGTKEESNFVTANEAKDIYQKAFVELMESDFEDTITQLNDDIRNVAEEGYNTLVFVVSDTRLNKELTAFLTNQGYAVEAEVDEDGDDVLNISWE